MAVSVEWHGTRLDIIGQAVKKPSALLKKIGQSMVSLSQQAFKEQKYESGWAPRRVPNVPGALMDLAQGPNVKARRFDPRPAGVDTGRLRGSIAFRVIGETAVEVGSNLPYAGLICFGGVSEVVVTQAMRDNLATWLRKQAKTNKEAREDFGWVFSYKVGETIKFRVTARSFIGLNERVRTILNGVIYRHLRESPTP